MENIEFLLMIVNKELEEERRTTDDKNFISDLIKAKRWLLKQKTPSKDSIGTMINNIIIHDDEEDYLLS